MVDKQKPSFLFYDYETFGQNPALDRPAQFAGIRTDLDFNIIEKPQKFFCAPSDDYLPQPQSVMITGITPQYTITNGINEPEFAKRIHASFSVSNSCILGYNNIRFDDEITRHIFYRNFYDPYSYSWKQGNSRWDLLNVLRACFTLRPNGINWPRNEKGLPSFKLKHLTSINGIEHKNPHDAMADVFATIEMAKLTKKAQPKLFDFFFQMRKKSKIFQLINIESMTPLVYVSSIFSANRTNITLISPLAWHPKNSNTIIACDLTADINPLLTLDINTLRKRLYTIKTELSDEPIIPIKLIYINKCPILAPSNILRQEDLKHLSLDINTCLNNLDILRKNRKVQNKVIQLYIKQKLLPEITDVDSMLYSRFFTYKDHSMMSIIRHTLPENLPALNLKFKDPRMSELFFRYRARNYPATLTKQEQVSWLQYRRNILNKERITKYLRIIDQLFIEYQEDKEKHQQLKLLVDYVNQIAG